MRNILHVMLFILNEHYHKILLPKFSETKFYYEIGPHNRAQLKLITGDE